MNCLKVCSVHTVALMAFALVGCVAAQAAAPVVSNVRASQRAGVKDVDIFYDLTDPDSTSLTVWILVSSDAGATFNVPASSFTGAAGGGVSPGANKSVVWHAGADWDGQFSSQCRVRVIAHDADPQGLVTIPAGAFLMGDTLSEGTPGEIPVHSVSVGAFQMDRADVTYRLWSNVRQWAISVGYSFDNAGLGKAPDHPVQTVNWFDAVKWCNARSQNEGLTPAYYTEAGLVNVYKTGQWAPSVKWSANGYRLPTEAEWEKAARGGLPGKRFPWGGTITHNQANYSSSTAYAYDTSLTRGYNPTYAVGGTPYTSPVASFPSNGYGLFDMAGNVWQWCWDWYDGTWYSNAGATQDNTRGPAGPMSYRVLRGGSWDGNAYDARCANRGLYTPALALDYVGFRCVRGL